MEPDVDIDDTDRKILAALRVDGRAGASELADAAGVATSTATKRLQRLEASGVIDEYLPDVDYEAIGYEVTAVFRLDVAGEGLADVVAELQATGRMVGVYEVTGSDDVVAIGKFVDTDELNAQIKDLLTHEHVRSATTNVVLESVCEGEIPPVDTG